MKKLKVLSLLFIFLLFSLNNIVFAQWKISDDDLDKTVLLDNATLPGSKLLMNNSHLGKNFFITLHPVWQQYDTEERIFVYSYKDTYVTIETPGGTSRITKAVKAYQATVFSSKKSEIIQMWDASHSESVTDFGLHVFSDDPIGVYVYTSSISYAGEGYQAIPVEVWGKDYYNCSYYDFIYSGNGGHYAGGFVIVASEDKTNIQVVLKGVGSGKTQKGRSFGETLSARLNAGQTYLVCGKAETSGLFDLTGSHITADKPIGVVSYHAFSCITSQTTNFGNYFDEMLMPLHLWGKSYITVNFSRSGAKGNLGDYFRVLGSQEQTKWHMDYYDEVSGKKLGQLGTTLKKPGDFFEYYQSAESGVPSVRGVSVWDADKPFMVMQYAYSHQWDDDINWQPVMIQLASIEQYLSPLIFYAPPETNSELNLFAIGETGDKDYKKLKTIRINGEYAYKKSAQFLINNIPGTNIYWAKISISPGVYVLEGETKMAGFLTRYRPSSLGWYIGMGTNKIDEYDVKAPALRIDKISCGKYVCTATETQNGKAGDVPLQADQGISRIALIEEESYNYTLSIDNADKFKPQNKITQQSFHFSPADSAKKAFAKFFVLDRAGNYAIDSIYYEPDNFSFSSGTLGFGNCPVSGKKEACFTIKNNMSLKIGLIIDFKNPKFSLADASQKNLGIEGGDSVSVRLTYSPTVDSYNKTDYDTLHIISACSQQDLAVSGKGTAPKVHSVDWDFKKVELNKSVSLEEQNGGKGLAISNTGSDTLVVFSIDNIHSPFLLKEPNPAFPFSVAPGETADFRTIAFMPVKEGDFSDTLTIKTNALDGDSLVVIKGSGFMKDTTGIHDNAVASGQNCISIKPNPSSGGEICIDYYISSCSDVIINICDLKGTIIRSFNQGELNMGSHSLLFQSKSLPSGTYYVVLQSGGSQVSEKLVISK